MALPILTTKLYSPPRSPSQIGRPRLIERLDEGLRLGRRLTLVSAPPGYGKTTLVAEWLHHLADSSQSAAFNFPPSSAWLSLDEGDNDPSRFFTYLLAALEQADPSLGGATRSLIGTPQAPPLEEVAVTLINEISASQASIIVALDDFHCLHSPYVHAVLEVLLRNQPANLHLVLIGRQDPPFSIAQLRARGLLTEIRAADLRFTTGEAVDFLNGAMNLGLQVENVEALAARTEGWIASLQLAALSLQGLDAAQAGEFVESFRGSHRYVIDYLLEEVIKRQPEATRRFITETCVLERFNAPLCAALTGQADAAEILAGLERANLFLIPLDDRRGWFRYHHLFADALRADLDSAVEQDLHRKAANWFEANDGLLDAIQHSLKGGDHPSAARLMARAAGTVIQNGELMTLLGWLQALPEAAIQDQPDLALYRAAVLVFTGQAEAARQVAGLWDQMTAAGVSRETRGRIAALRSWIAVSQAQSGALQMAQDALQQLGEDDSFFRVVALLSTGTALNWSGDVQASSQAYRQAWELGRDKGYAFAGLGALANLVFNLMEMGLLNEANALCQQAKDLYVDRRGQPLPVLGVIYLPLAVIHYERDELDESERNARQGLELCQRLFSSAVMGGDGEMVLAQVAMARGRAEEAFAIIDDTRAEARRRNIPYLGYKMDLQEAALHLTQGDLESVEGLLLAPGGLLEAKVPGVKYSLEKLLAQLRLAQGRAAEALEILEKLEALDRAKGLQGRRIHLLTFQAEAYAALGKRSEALQRIEAALRLAAPQGYRRCFTRRRPALRALLEEASAVAPGFVAGLLAAAPALTKPAVPAAAAGDELVEPLSEQERKVLRLVCAGLSNQEIAAELVIGLGTAKWHVHNVLSKLGVSSRAQAIVRAKELKMD